ncbi:MAG: Si-specific NAD(P)(+) transhydrogenase [Oligoflexia bacterium]|nr:Si-specific NAD(P)(+) transhydrogenase [Oligoflexia bacterium]
MTFDLIVIGSGPAGQRAALQGAKIGKTVAIIEELPALGGGCVHFGTLPSKSFRESVYRWSLGSRGTLGNESEHSQKVSKKIGELPDMQRLLRRRNRVVSEEAKIVYDQLKRNHVSIYHGHAKLLSPTEVEIQSKKGIEKLSAKVVIIAVGARPVAPEHLEVDGERVHDSNTILNQKELPKTMVVLGAGIIGAEYASMFSMAGTKVYLVDRRNEILASVDREIVNHLVDRFEAQGVEIVLECEASKIEYKADKSGLKVHLSNQKNLEVDMVLVALGRVGNSSTLGLDAVGVESDERGLIRVDQHFQTSIRGVYAVGDVVGQPALASTSMEQGRIACSHAFDLKRVTMPRFFPYGIYTIPEISMIGDTEESLIAQKKAYVVGRASYRELARGQIVGDRWGLLKLLVEPQTQKLLGVHIVGDNAAELIHIGQAVMTLGGGLSYFVENVFNYPTLAEAYKTAALHAENQLRQKTASSQTVAVS